MKTTKQFIKDAREKHGDKYDYSKAEYLGRDEKICIICPEHGEFWQTPHNHLKGQNCPKCSIESSRRKRIGKKHICKCRDNNDFINIVRQKFGSRFVCSEYINSTTKIKIVCPKHGEFYDIPKNFINNKYGCPGCYIENLKSTKENFIKEANKIHNNEYDYSEVEYLGVDVPVKIICPKHGEFWQTPWNHIKIGCNCPSCNSSKGEQRIKNFLNFHSIKFVYNKDCLEFLNKMRPDFYLPDYNLIIEYDGEQHFEPIKVFGGEEKLKETKRLDELKNQLCEENNINIIRIPYWDYDNIEKILEGYFYGN